MFDGLLCQKVFFLLFCLTEKPPADAEKSFQLTIKVRSVNILVSFQNEQVGGKQDPTGIRHSGELHLN